MKLFKASKDDKHRREFTVNLYRGIQKELRKIADEYWGWDIDREKYDACIRAIDAIDRYLEQLQNE